MPSLVLIGGCGFSSPDPELLFTGVSIPPVVESKARGSARLEVVRTIGELEGPLAFGNILHAAVSSDGILAVSDGLDCSVALVDLEDGQLLGRVGGCGSGPGELRTVNGLTFIGDTLLVYDTGSGSIHWLDRSGQEHRRVRLAGVHDYVVGMHALGDNRVALQLALRPASQVGPAEAQEHRIVAIVDSRSGEVIGRTVTDPKVSQTNPGSLYRSVAVCASPPHAADRFVVALNEWAFEGLVVDGDELSPVARFMTPVEWTGPREDPQSDRGLLPGSRGSVACGDSLVMLKHGRVGLDDGPGSTTVAWMEARSYDGRLVGRWPIERGDTMYRGGPVAAYGDSFFLVSSSASDYPILREMRVVGRD